MDLDEMAKAHLQKYRELRAQLPESYAELRALGRQLETLIRLNEGVSIALAERGAESGDGASYTESDLERAARIAAALEREPGSA